MAEMDASGSSQSDDRRKGSNNDKDKSHSRRSRKQEAQSRWLYAVDEEWRPFDDDDNKAIEKAWKLLIASGKLPKDRRKQQSTDDNDDEASKTAKDGRDGKDDKGKSDEEAKSAEERTEDSNDEGDAKDDNGDDGDQSLGDKLSSFLGKGGKNLKKAVSSGTATPKEGHGGPGGGGGEGEGEDASNFVNEHLDPDAPDEDREMRVAVMEDKLFDVDLKTMKLFPVFWKGVLLPITRAHWFYSAADGGYAPIPSDEGLSHDLDKAYHAVKPWRKFGKNQKGEPAAPGESTETEEEPDDGEHFKASNNDNEAQDPNKLNGKVLYHLPSMSKGGSVHFESETLGHIYTKDVKGRFMAAFGGSLVVRGWDVAVSRSSKSALSSYFDASNLPWAAGHEPEQGKETSDASENDKHGAKTSQRRTGAAKADSAPQKAGSDGGAPSSSEEQESNQGLLGRLWPSSETLTRPHVALLRAIGWSKDEAKEEGQRKARQENTEEGLRKEEGNFEKNGDKGHDARYSVSDERSKEPPELVLVVHGIGQKLVEEFDALDFVYDVERLRNLSKSLSKHEDVRRISRGKRVQYLPICWRRDLSFDEAEPIKGNDNKYGLQDVSNDASIPMVRNIISKVVLDVPYYLSRHKKTMVDAVKAELNRVYRLFALRNPSFERDGGRVSLICHSLGSSIAVDILSNQPTLVPSLYEQGDEYRRPDAPLCFNVRNLFFVGSPNGFFFHLHGGQLIARKGTARTRDMNDDIALDKVGRYGCLAVEAIYNCYNTTDPVAFKLAPTVDREYARMLRPIALSEAVPALLEALALPRLSLSKYFEVVHPFSKAGDAAAMPANRRGASHKGVDAFIDKADSAQRGTKAAEKAEQAGSEKQDESSDEESEQNDGDEENVDKRDGQGVHDRSILLEKGASQKKSQFRAKARQEDVRKDDFDFERLIKAEKRFRALNPHGCIDFTFESGGYNQYLEMLSAHVSYWTSKTFATFVLTQLLYDEKKHEAPPPTIVPELDVRARQKQQHDEKREEDKEEQDDEDGGSNSSQKGPDGEKDNAEQKK